ncbi:signal recognition particle-docking protein FtsY [Erysipelothrix anatis]|uniref:signal recognition particle-docking protein FtsY n=1 Tax=Erysipelothrix anatis TaxID=2683713 RepID=UPI0013584DFD|nr:signal recognition particle-docking protein FtsY [Erysipelothrix anatis]
MGFFDKLKQSFSKKEDKELYSTGLDSTKATFGTKLKEMFTGKPKFDDAWYDHLLAVLIQSDVSLKSAQKIIKAFRKEVKPSMTQEESLETLAGVMMRQYGENIEPYALEDSRLNAILVVGVNGSGKTTTCAKLAHYYKSEGKRVLLVGGDTFRAAGSNQLKVWADEIGVDFIGGDEGRDAASVYVDAARHAKAEAYDVMICDSAGRLQNKVNLMKELDKMKRVLEREVGAIDHTYLVIDGNTGQNGLLQAKTFTEVTPIDSLIVTKLDGSPKGGVLLSIKDELGIKVSHIGLGEKMEDLRPFDIEAYLYNLVSDNA